MESTWVDPDDAPELTSEWFERAIPMIGGRVVSKEEFATAAREALYRDHPKAKTPKLALTVRYDADIVAAFKATGKGWQTRMNTVLRDWLQTHPAA